MKKALELEVKLLRGDSESKNGNGGTATEAKPKAVPGNAKKTAAKRKTPKKSPEENSEETETPSKKQKAAENGAEV